MVLASDHSDRVPHPCFELIRKLVIMVADIIVVYGEYNCVGRRLGGGGGGRCMYRLYRSVLLLDDDKGSDIE